jgi:hypothetical protein
MSDERDPETGSTDATSADSTPDGSPSPEPGDDIGLFPEDERKTFPPDYYS